jgi:trans-aconitate methyltransferase
LRLIRAPGARILDVGCGNGALGRSLKAEGASMVVGIEAVPSEAERAKDRLDVVIAADVDDVDVGSFESPFDYLIFADVLEHLPRPERTLHRLLPTLTDNGVVIVSVPNMRFWSVLVRLVVDRWEYAEHGVRDVTHLRIFTRRSLAAMVDSVGLVPVSYRRNLRLIDDQSRIGRGGAVLTRLAVASLGRVPIVREFLTYQYVVVAGRK